VDRTRNRFVVVQDYFLPVRMLFSTRGALISWCHSLTMKKRTENGEGKDRNHILTVLGLGVAALSLIVAVGPAMVDMGIVDRHRIPGLIQESQISDAASNSLPPVSDSVTPKGTENQLKAPRDLSGANAQSNSNGDLAVGTPITFLPCDERYIVIVRNSKNESAYADEVTEALEKYPGSQYAVTKGSCNSLAQQSSNDTLLYIVFYGPYELESEACDKSKSTVPDFTKVYVKQLSPSGKPGGSVNCPSL